MPYRPSAGPGRTGLAVTPDRRAGQRSPRTFISVALPGPDRYDTPPGGQVLWLERSGPLARLTRVPHAGVHRETAMKSLEAIRSHVRRLLTAPVDELGRWAKLLRTNIQLWRFCMRRLRENNALAMSSALSFRTIFAMIPTLVLAVVALQSFGIGQNGKKSLRRLMEAGGIDQISIVQRNGTASSGPAGTQPAKPATTDESVSPADYIERVIDQAQAKLTLGRVGPIGVVLLIWSAVTLLTTMERSLNRIFEASRSRPLGQRVLLYWSAVTLCPMLLAAAIYTGRQAAETFTHVWWLSWLLDAANWAGPVVIGMVLLAALYKLMPNTKVGFPKAFGGALVAVPLWLLAKWGFSLYVRELVGKGSLYGALGLLPLFLIWLNLSWLIFLFGAQLAHTAANLERMASAERAERMVLGPSELLAAAIAVARDYICGRGPTSLEEIGTKLKLPGGAARGLMEKLTAGGFVLPVEQARADAYVLARPPENIAVAQIMDISGLPGRSGAAGRFDADIEEALRLIQQQAGAAMSGLTLARAAGAGETKS